MISAEVRNAKDGISQLKEIQVPSTMEHRTRMNDYDQLSNQHAQQAKRFKDLVEKFATVVQQAQLKAKQEAERKRQNQQYSNQLAMEEEK